MVVNALRNKDDACTGCCCTRTLMTVKRTRQRNGTAIRNKLNTWWLNLAHTAARRYRHQTAGLVTDVTKGWNPEEVSRRIESGIGRAVGVLLHAATHLVR
jgi:uncharacterized membrane-anchored protein YjiN (DUF445 family)